MKKLQYSPDAIEKLHEIKKDITARYGAEKSKGAIRMIQEKKTTGKFTSLWGLCLLCLCMVFCLLADMPVEAADSGTWKYRILEDGTVEIASYEGEEAEIVIPGMIRGRIVTSIEAYAFYGCSSITSIEIPSSVTSIGDRAFKGCSSLTSINVAENSQHYASKDGILYDKSCKTLICCPGGKQGTITIPDSVTSIAGGAFIGCSSITGIEIPGSVTSIESSAFRDCSSITSIEIPSSVMDIGYWVFEGCSSLENINVEENSQRYASKDGILYYESCKSLICCPKGKQGSITISSSVTYIKLDAFEGCSSLENINVEENSQRYASKDGILYDKLCETLISCPGGKQGIVTIPNSVTRIRNSAFEGCGSLTSITIPSSVTYIEMDTFRDCGSLTSIEIPSSVTNIGNSAFEGCSSLTSIEIPNSVTDIGWDAFEGCSSLTSIEIPDSVTRIGTFAFRGCSSLTSIEISGSVTSIEAGTFEGCSSLTSITIPDSVTDIGWDVFKDCSSLASITIPDSATSIGTRAFEGCSSLTSIEIPNSVTSIGPKVFKGCSSLTSITIPSSVTSIGNNAFEGCGADLTIYGEPGSYAEEYIKESGIEFKCSHTLVTDPAIAPTCMKAGKTEGIHCSICNEIIKPQEAIPTTAHTYQPTIQKATAKKNGTIEEKCSSCGRKKSITIYAASGIKLSKTSFTYNGKNKKPTVIIKDSKGNKLPAGSYKITRPKTSKKVGKYTITITLRGNYSGTVKLSYRITPKSTSLSKLTAKKKGFTAKWKKQTRQTTGYQLQYSTSKKFKGAKTVTVKKNKTISKSIKKLKAGKKYYVRIRTYKTVKIKGKNVKICSGWSKVKSVKTKK